MRVRLPPQVLVGDDTMFKNTIEIQARVTCSRCSRKTLSWMPLTVNSDDTLEGELTTPTDWHVVGRYREQGEREIVCPECTKEFAR